MNRKVFSYCNKFLFGNGSIEKAGRPHYIRNMENKRLTIIDNDMIGFMFAL